MASDGEERLGLFDLWPEPGANVKTQLEYVEPAFSTQSPSKLMADIVD